MKHRSVMFDSCWGLAFAALAPLVIGTDLVTAPSAHAATMVATTGGGDGEPDGWPDPCLDDPESDACTFFLEWLGVQDDVWSMLWDAPYVHGKSTMSIEQIGTAYPVGLWNVAVWEDAELDYEDPDLDEQDVLDQMVAEGFVDIMYAEPITWHDDMHVDPDDGTVTTVFATVFIAAGTLIGQTGLDAHVLATVTRLEVSNSLGSEQVVVNMGVIKTTETVDAALNLAVEIVEVVMEMTTPPTDTQTGPDGQGTDPGDDPGFDGGSGDGGPPDRELCDQCYPCQWATTPDAPPMTDECCDCYSDYNDCSESCRLTGRIATLDCLQDLGLGLIGGGSMTVGCVAACFKFASSNPWALAACLAGCGVVLGVTAAVLYICKKKGDAARDLCMLQSNCNANLAACLQANDCN